MASTLLCGRIFLSSHKKQNEKTNSEVEVGFKEILLMAEFHISTLKNWILQPRFKSSH